MISFIVVVLEKPQNSKFKIIKKLKMVKDKYLSKLITPSQMRGGCVMLNEQITGMVIENITEISFIKLYPNLLLHLYDNNILSKFNIEIPNEVITKLKHLFDNGLEHIQENKTWMNSLWIKELRPIGHEMIDLFYQYMEMFYQDVINLIPYNWLYIDTDTLFFVDDEKGNITNKFIKNLYTPIPYDFERRNLAFFEAKKRYIIADNNNTLKQKGFLSYGRQNKMRHKRHDEIVTIMKSHIRDTQLCQILS